MEIHPMLHKLLEPTTSEGYLSDKYPEVPAITTAEALLKLHGELVAYPGTYCYLHPTRVQVALEAAGIVWGLARLAQDHPAAVDPDVAQRVVHHVVTALREEAEMGGSRHGEHLQIARGWLDHANLAARISA
jgi:hypothetical protein